MSLMPRSPKQGNWKDNARHCSRHKECTCDAGCGPDVYASKRAYDEYYRSRYPNKPASVEASNDLTLLEKWYREHEHNIRGERV